MFSVVLSGGVRGMTSFLAAVETDASNGLPCLELVGFLSGEVKEAKERVRVALKNAGVKIPAMRITVNISPADVRKSGSAFDLPIAVGIMVSLGYLEKERVKDILFIGELGLNGEIKPVKGVLPVVLEARRHGMKACLVPRDNAAEGKAVEGIRVIGLSSLSQTEEYLKAEGELREELERKYEKTAVPDAAQEEEADFSEISGQDNVKRAAQIAAAGFHPMLMIGPPGSGKTMTAQRIPSILPPLTKEESLEVSSVYSVAGLLPSGGLISKRPFVSPHHTASGQSLAGGGGRPRPGMVSLAHKGILFLDELAEFKRGTLDILRQPMEEKRICIARSSGNFWYPADFMLVAATNPCPCGYFPDRNRCRCSEGEIRRYLGHISGPVLDRIDLCVETKKLGLTELRGKGAESSRQMKERVMSARERQEIRFAGKSVRFNSQMDNRTAEVCCGLGPKEKKFMAEVFRAMDLSARAYYKILKTARTIADLDGQDKVERRHLAEAVYYRMDSLVYGENQA